MSVTTNYGWRKPEAREAQLEILLQQILDDVDADVGALATLLTAVGASSAWTPVVTIGGSSAGITYSTQSGRYQRVGKVVTIQCRITLSSKGGLSGAVLITGLPVAAESPEAAAGAYVNNAAYTGSLTVLAGNSSTAMSLWVGNNGMSAQLTGANLTNTSDFAFSLIYRAL
jgi:hypothetical protein